MPASDPARDLRSRLRRAVQRWLRSGESERAGLEQAIAEAKAREHAHPSVTAWGSRGWSDVTPAGWDDFSGPPVNDITGNDEWRG